MGEGMPAQSKSAERLKAWKQGPIVLASGSLEKQRQLRELDLDHVEVSPTPDEIEDELLDRITENGEGHHDERIAMYVARRKVEYLVEEGIADDALVCGFDTIPILTRRDEHGKRVRKYLRKPKSLENAEEIILDAFTTIAEGKLLRNYRESLDSEGLTPYQKHIFTLMHRVGLPDPLMIVSTGMAIRLPGKGDEIELSLSHARLRLDAVHAVAELPEDEREQYLKELTHKTLEIMGDKWRSVAGGIDYSSPEIWNLLGIVEAKAMEEMDDVEEGTFKGVPKRAFDQFLSALARNAE